MGEKHQDIECKVCKSETKFIFNGKVLNKYIVGYFQCSKCKFIQTEDPFWLEEAYSSAIGFLDVGLLYRNIFFSELTPPILDKLSTAEDSYLDYGGGYGVFVRLMRDKGYDFFLYDKYCENLFAKLFELKDYKYERFKALTAFEVFEHLVCPIEEISNMWKYTDVIIFSTELQPNTIFTSDEDWWYFVPSGGQHVAFYHLDTLKTISEIFSCNVYSNGVNLHVLSKVDFEDPFKSVEPSNRLEKLINKLKQGKKKMSPTQRKSLLISDFDFYKNKLNTK